MKCRQIASGAAYVDDKGNWVEVHDAKLDALDSVIEEANGMPVLVAYNFKSDLARILKRFPQARHLDSNPSNNCIANLAWGTVAENEADKQKRRATRLTSS